MKIESILKRPGGTKVTMGDSLYHFAPNEQDQHVAEVENPDHAKVFLNIPEGYRSLDPIQPQQVSLEDAMAVLKAQFPNADFSALTAAAGPALAAATSEPDPEPDAQEPDDAGDDAEDDPAGLADMSDEELRAEFEKLIGRKPHAAMLRENMEAQITAALSEAGK